MPRDNKLMLFAAICDIFKMQYMTKNISLLENKSIFEKKNGSKSQHLMMNRNN